MSIDDKITSLKKLLMHYNSVLIAFSGGVDSTFLLAVASSVLPRNKLLAVTATSSTYPKEELEFSKRISRALGARHAIIRTHELRDSRFVSNSIQRCYFCKKELFSRIKKIAREKNLNVIADASTLSDLKDFRPGSKAKEELGIRSPLQEAGFTKRDIRRASKKAGLLTWDKPSLACLASRIPYGTAITSEMLENINKAEQFLKRLGFQQVRVRHYGKLCRIEVAKRDIASFVHKRNTIVKKLSELGYNYITLDLEGYRSGSMNEVVG
jgi:uncharacterized protein